MYVWVWNGVYKYAWVFISPKQGLNTSPAPPHVHILLGANKYSCILIPTCSCSINIVEERSITIGDRQIEILTHNSTVLTTIQAKPLFLPSKNYGRIECSSPLWTGTSTFYVVRILLFWCPKILTQVLCKKSPTPLREHPLLQGIKGKQRQVSTEEASMLRPIPYHSL